MVLRLLPLQVEAEDITAANGSILTPEAVNSFFLCGGDFGDAVPYCLLVARHSFHKEAYRNPSDFDEHMNHKLACEVLARRVVQKLPAERQHIVLSTRYSRVESDGDISLPLSAIELASDLHCPIFLSSGESQKTVFALWKGHVRLSMMSTVCQADLLYYASWCKTETRKGHFLMTKFNKST